MTFSVRKEASGVVVLGVRGRLVVSNRHELSRRVQEALDDGAKKFVVDFAETEFIDSPGLGILVSLSKSIRESGGTLRLASLNEDIQALFELTKLDTLFSVTETTEEALASF